MRRWFPAALILLAALIAASSRTEGAQASGASSAGRMHQAAPAGARGSALQWSASGLNAPEAGAPMLETLQGSAEIEIRVVPAMAGIRFRLFIPCTLYLPLDESMSSFCFSGDRPPPANQMLVTDDQGIARASVERLGLYFLQVLPWEANDLRLEFRRWGDDVFLAERELMVDSSLSLEAGFDIFREAQLSFVDLDGRPVDPGRITSLTLRSSHGNVHTLEQVRSEWLQAARVLRRDAGLEEVEIVYSVQSVIVDGSNVVNRGQQRFIVDPGGEWRLELLLYPARFATRDALFGFPIGTGIQLEYPDGNSETLPLGPEGKLELDSLARGTYRVHVTGAPGFAPPTLFVLSRSQEVRPMVISYLDLAIVLLGGASLALGLLLIGRPNLYAAARERASLRGLTRGSKETAEEATGASE